MNRILVHIPMLPYGEYDIFSESNNSKLLDLVNGYYKGVCPNVGNRLWFQGLMSVIQSPENKIEFYTPTMKKDEVNSNYDFIIAPMANVFSIEYASLLESLAEKFEGIKIPIYVIACGVQAERYEDLDSITSALKFSASKFIKTIYNTGGEFALRGYFTKEFFTRLGFNSAVVTGCPSLFQLGRDLRIKEEKVSKEEFRLLLNGRPEDYKDIMREYPECVFFDQSIYYHELWNPEYFNKFDSDGTCLKMLINRYGLDVTEYILQDRIRLIPHMNEWRNHLISEKFSFSYGSRIHGSIMPILAGIPVVLESRDVRTKEMADFFRFPCVPANEYKKYDSLYDLYQNTNYNAFNESFAAHFDAYEAFLKKCGIVDCINSENTFFHPLDNMPDVSLNREKRAELLELLHKKQGYWRSYNALLMAKRKISSKLCIK